MIKSIDFILKGLELPELEVLMIPIELI